jgi:uncharacterized protein (PEP-CTERM system associated)
MHAVARRGVTLGASIAAVAAASVHAQAVVAPESVSGRGLSVVPTLSISETATNNVGLSSTDRRADLVSQVTPGIRVDSRGGRVRGFFDYSLTGIAYARESSNNDLQNALNSAVNVEAIENFAFVDFRGNISQQAISAYGTRSADSSLINGNRTEVRTFAISPYVKGRLASFADYEVRWTQNWTRNSSTDSANNTSSVGSLHFEGESGLRVVSWAADASHQVYDYAVGRRTVDDTVRAVVYVAVNPQLRLSLIDGEESNNILSADKESHTTPGFGLDWQPTERTQISGQYEKRFFGSSHNLSFVHRTPRTVWRYSDVQDVTTGFGQPVLGSLGTAYDLFFTQFASLEPDPALRASLVNAFLLANGIAPTTQVFTGSLASAVTRQRRQELSFALLGIRDTVTVSASQTQALRLDNTVVVADDFANGNLVRERGVSLGIAHRLPALGALNLLASIDRTTGNVTSQSTTLRSVSLYWTQQFSPRTNFSLGAHHSSFRSPSQPYSETGVTAAVGLRL